MSEISLQGGNLLELSSLIHVGGAKYRTYIEVGAIVLFLWAVSTLIGRKGGT